MSPPSFSTRGSEARSRATRQFTAAGTASRTFRSCVTRAVSPGSAISARSRASKRARTLQKRPSAVDGCPSAEAAISSNAWTWVTGRGSSSVTSRPAAASSGSDTRLERSAPSSRRSDRLRASMYSIAETSTPSGSPARHVSRASVRRAVAQSRAWRASLQTASRAYAFSSLRRRTRAEVQCTRQPGRARQDCSGQRFRRHVQICIPPNRRR